MPTTIAKIDILNIAFAKLGVKPISDLEDLDSIAAEQGRLQWPLAFSAVARAHGWNCLLEPAQLAAVAQDPITPVTPVPTGTDWAPNTAYAVGDYVNFGEPAYLYQCLIANTSSASFTNDLTQGYWFQTDIFNPNPFGSCNGGSNYISGWAYKYNLPADCLRLVTLNDRPCEGFEEEFQIMGISLYTNESTAIIEYVKATEDTTRFDPMFVDCLTFKLAAMMATILRQDDTRIGAAMNQEFRDALRKARTVDAGERKPRRFNPVANSRFVGSRISSTNN